MYQIATKLPNGHKIYQMAVIYSKWPQKMPNFFHSKALQNLPKFLVLKRTIWQTLIGTRIANERTLNDFNFEGWTSH
jgi:hypothetical protein